jgi:hypothetical protein
VPSELRALLVCITHAYNVRGTAKLSHILSRVTDLANCVLQVAKLSHLHVMLTALTYQSQILDVLLVTDRVIALQTALHGFFYPLNISYYEGKRGQDIHTYWLTWVQDYTLIYSVLFCSGRHTCDMASSGVTVNLEPYNPMLLSHRGPSRHRRVEVAGLQECLECGRQP